jgi:hypothetical protein
MAVGIGAGGVVGLAIETTSGTYEPPSKFFPVRSESLQWTQGTVWRRVVGLETADVIGAVEGDGHVEGSLDMEVLDDILPYFLECARGTLTQSGTSAPYTYTFEPDSRATPSETMTIHVERNGIVFAYTGCVVSEMSFSVDNGQFVVEISIIGRNESEQANATTSYDSSGPFGAGMWTIELPTGTQIEDSDNLTLDINDNGEAQNRLRSERGAAFISYGEREVTLSLDRDFESRAEYNNFRNLTNRDVRINANNPNAGYVQIDLHGSIIDSFDLSMDGQGDLIRSSIQYMGIDQDATGSYTIEVESDENLGL